jgi:hypothetical protein
VYSYCVQLGYTIPNHNLFEGYGKCLHYESKSTPQLCLLHPLQRGPDSVVGIANGYGLDGPGIESRWGRGFPHLSRPALGPTQPPVQWYLVFPGGKERWGGGGDADPSPPSSAVVMKG